MSLNKIFSSKPKQIAQAALQVLSNVYGDLENVKIIVISDMQSTLNIAENFKQSLSGGCCILEESFDKFLKTNEDNLVKNEKFIDKSFKRDNQLIDFPTNKNCLYPTCPSGELSNE